MDDVEVSAFGGGLAAVGAIPEVIDVAAGVNEIPPAVIDKAFYGINVAIDEGTEDVVNAVAVRGEGVR